MLLVRINQSVYILFYKARYFQVIRFRRTESVNMQRFLRCVWRELWLYYWRSI